MSHPEDFEKWSKEVISKIIENLGQNVDEVRYEFSKQDANIMSVIYYICVKFKETTKDQNRELSVVLKRPGRLESFRKLTNSDIQFQNEIVFYRMCGQPNEDNGNFAKCFYIDERPPIDSVIALENVNTRGYYSCPCKYNAPLEYTLAAMREIGRFHGKGYVMKELQREKFFAVIEQLQEIRYDKSLPAFHEFVDIIAPRAVEYLRNRGHDVSFCDKTEALLSRAFDKLMVKAVEPREPLSTMCHGDLTLSNTLFKTENDGQYRAMLIDFAFLRYATPVIDLSTYLCLCCSNEVRRDKFSEIMRAYHDALKEYLLEAGIWDVEKYSYDALLEDFRRGGLFGFVITSHYLPILMGCGDGIDDMKQITIEGYVERAKPTKQLGGDEMSKLLADMLLHLNDIGCLKYFS